MILISQFYLNGYVKVMGSQYEVSVLTTESFALQCDFVGYTDTCNYLCKWYGVN